MSALPQRPFTVLIAALGGEGGGVLADWLVDAASAEGYPVQSTSIPGVSQRTGATTYYLEIYPVKAADLNGRMPVMALVPSPGGVDLVAASELVEAGRAIQNAYVTGDCTTLIASTHRIYAVAEKASAGDSRYDSEKLVAAARQFAKRAILADLSRLAQRAGTVINAVLFGAMAGAGVLPLSRRTCEEAIRAGGKGAEASLRGFDAGFALAAGGEAISAATEAAAARTVAAAERVRREFPATLHALLDEAAARLTDYQDAAYAQLFLDRVRQIHAVDREAEGAGDGFKLTREAARLLALWMSYEDVIRVAELKTRAGRFERVRREVGARPDQPVVVVDYLKPGVDELCSVLPPRWAQRLRLWDEKRGHKPLSRGLKVKTSGVAGFLMMRSLTLLKPWRRRTSRYAEEQALIERWLGGLKRLGFAALDRRLALEIALCAQLVRGYGETRHKGRAALVRIFDTLVENEAAVSRGVANLTESIRRAREAALAAEGMTSAPAPVPASAGGAKPIVWMSKKTPTSGGGCSTPR